MSINRRKVEGRRELHFETLDDIAKDVQRMTAGPTRTLGNWTIAQIVGHLALSMHASLEPIDYRAPFFVRWLAPWFKKSILNNAMKPGVNAPKRLAAFFEPPDSITLDEAAPRLRAVIERLKNEEERAPNTFLGQLTKKEDTLLHLRHAEMHLSFIVPAEGG